MSINVGGINLVEAIINIDYELNRTQRILEWIMQNNQIKIPDQTVMGKIDEETIKALQIKYPQAGIAPKAK